MGYKFTPGTDWVTPHIDVWNELLNKEHVGKPVHYLEIGCFEGRATVWFLENVLMHPDSTITVVDTFEGSDEFTELHIKVTPFELKKRFYKNIIETGRDDQVITWKQRSDVFLKICNREFDFAYIDGSHHAFDVLRDSVLAWDLLKIGGIMLWDDYAWNPPADYGRDVPATGIQAFLMAAQEGIEYKILHWAYQVAVRKLR